MINKIKINIFKTMMMLHVDEYFRHLNRDKLLILCYHGVTRNKYRIPPWTLIHEKFFEEQIKYISENYKVITLREAVSAISGHGNMPSNAAVITFDDGYRNNLLIALPILQKYKAHATIFLTAGLVDTEKILPLDLVYLIITNSRKSDAIRIPEFKLGPYDLNTKEGIRNCYQEVVEYLKRYKVISQWKCIEILRKHFDCHEADIDVDSVNEFKLLSWEDINVLLNSGIIEIGAHTISHEILTNLSVKEASQEIEGAKAIIESKMNIRVDMFAYPNGTEKDFSQEHINHLKKSKFICALTTKSGLNVHASDLYRLERYCLGPDLTSEISIFIAKVSGITTSIKNVLKLC